MSHDTLTASEATFEAYQILTAARSMVCDAARDFADSQTPDNLQALKAALIAERTAQADFEARAVASGALTL